MDCEKLQKDHLIKRQSPDFEQIKSQLKRAKKDLLTAEAVVPIDLTWSFAIAYHAMMRAGKALMFSKGYLPTGKNPHKTVMEFTGFVLGDEYQDLLLRFDRMRRKRHDFLYDSHNHTTIHETRSGIKTAREFINKIIAMIADDATGGLF